MGYYGRPEKNIEKQSPPKRARADAIFFSVSMAAVSCFHNWSTSSCLCWNISAHTASGHQLSLWAKICPSPIVPSVCGDCGQKLFSSDHQADAAAAEIFCPAALPDLRIFLPFKAFLQKLPSHSKSSIRPDWCCYLSKDCSDISINPLGSLH